MKNTKEIIIEQLFYSHEFNLCKKNMIRVSKTITMGLVKYFLKNYKK